MIGINEVSLVLGLFSDIVCVFSRLACRYGSGVLFEIGQFLKITIIYISSADLSVGTTYIDYFLECWN